MSNSSVVSRLVAFWHDLERFGDRVTTEEPWRSGQTFSVLHETVADFGFFSHLSDFVAIHCGAEKAKVLADCVAELCAETQQLDKRGLHRAYNLPFVGALSRTRRAVAEIIAAAGGRVPNHNLMVLRTINELQFTGWAVNATRRLVPFDPVPVAVLFGELAGSDINIVRELRILEVEECIRRDAAHWDGQGLDVLAFFRSDGKRVDLDPDAIQLPASSNCSPVRVSWDNHYMTDVPIPAEARDFIRRRYSMTQHGREVLKRLANGQREPAAPSGEGAGRVRGRPKGSKKADSLGRFATQAAKRLEGNGGGRIPVKQLIDEYKRESGQTVSYEAMRTRVRDALGRR